MKIGLVINDVSRGRGSERVAITIANLLSQWYAVSLISLNQENKQPFFSISEIVRIIQLEEIADSYSYKLCKKISEVRQLKAVQSNEQYNLLIGVGSYPSMLLGVMRRMHIFDRQIKLIGWEQANRSAITNKFWKYLRKFAYRKLDGLICLNESDRKDFQSFAPSSISIPNPLSFKSDVVSNLDNKQIISIGAFEAEKGFDLLIAAFQTIAEKIPEWILVLIGEGSLKAALEKQIVDTALSERVVIKGPVKDIQNQFLNSSIYVLPSRREGFGMVLIEAMECGLPCISFDCPTGPRHIISQNENGILVEPEDTYQISRAILKLINDRESMSRLASAGRLTVKRFYPDIVIEAWKMYLNNIFLSKK